DWSQNDDHKTTVCVYSLRAKDRPTASTPVTWDEVRLTLEKKDPNLLVFLCEQTLQRVDKMGDLFEPVLKLKQKLPALSAIEEESAAASTGNGNTGGRRRAAHSKPQPKPAAKAKPVRKKVGKRV